MVKQKRKDAGFETAAGRIFGVLDFGRPVHRRGAEYAEINAEKFLQENNLGVCLGVLGVLGVCLGVLGASAVNAAPENRKAL